MSLGSPKSDDDVLGLLQISGLLGVSELSAAMEVTQTAVRQRLTRLMNRGMVQRTAARHGRGRPQYRYALTEKGIRETGSNFNDLAVVLWKEVNQETDSAARQETLRRVARALATVYALQIEGDTPEERLASLAELLHERRIPATIENSEHGAALNIYACSYPGLAEKDPALCGMEQMLFSELAGCDVKLIECRLQGGTLCRFHVH